MAVADPSRWRIVRLLEEKPRTVTQLAEATGLSVAAACRHVQRLRAVGVVQARRRGKELQCRPAPPDTPEGRWLERLLDESLAVSGRAAEPRVTVTAPKGGRTSAAPSASRSSEKPPANRPKPYRELEDYLL
jgi:DNA-binding transcriptional ArsR family regulator